MTKTKDVSLPPIHGQTAEVQSIKHISVKIYLQYCLMLTLKKARVDNILYTKEVNGHTLPS